MAALLHVDGSKSGSRQAAKDGATYLGILLAMWLLGDEESTKVINPPVPAPWDQPHSRALPIEHHGSECPEAIRTGRR